MSSVSGPVTDYLPHRPPMLLIDRIDDATSQGADCTATIKPDCPFLQNGHVHPSAMIEFVAQTCAIAAGVEDQLSGAPPRLGFIVGCREVLFAVDQFSVGDELTIVVRKLIGGDQLAAFSGTVSRGGVVCVTIQMSVVEAELAGTQFVTPGGHP